MLSPSHSIGFQPPPPPPSVDISSSVSCDGRMRSGSVKNVLGFGNLQIIRSKSHDGNNEESMKRPKTIRQLSTTVYSSSVHQHGFPLRKELSCNQIKNLGLDSEQSTMIVKPVTKRPVTAKQRRKSFFQFRQRSSQGSMTNDQKNIASSTSIVGEDSFCPIYAKKNIVLRRKSLAADLLLRSKSVAHDDYYYGDYGDPGDNDEKSSKQQQSMRSDSHHHPSISISSNMSTDGDHRKNSLIHEVRVLSPRNSLKGVFYSSSVISIRNSNSNELYGGGGGGGACFDEMLTLGKKSDSFVVNQPSSSITAAATAIETETAQATTTTKASELNEKIQKFCIYFKWTSWMTVREEYSLFIFSPTNRFRRYCVWLADHPYFDYIVLIFISMNCITLAMERPKIPPHSKEREFLTIANFVFTLVFGIEMLIKVIAKGLFYGQNAYFHNGWNIMDGSLVGISLFDIFLSFFAQRSPRIFGILRVFRLLRSLRPLRYF